MLLSGRSLFHLKEATAEAPSLPRAFNQAGYVTYHHGKRGNTPQAIQTNFQTNKYLANDQQERSSGYPGKEIADAAVAFLGARPKDRPFFMYLAFANPHDPRVINREYRDRYDEPSMPLPRELPAAPPVRQRRAARPRRATGPLAPHPRGRPQRT